MKTRSLQALVVSANYVHRSLLEFNLAKLGFLVTVAMDAKEAFRLAEKRVFDLIITDYLMPLGTGVDLARQLRFLGTYDSTPMVLLADAHAELDVDYLRGELWMLVVREPFDLGELAQKIAEQFVAP